MMMGDTAAYEQSSKQVTKEACKLSKYQFYNKSDQRVKTARFFGGKSMSVVEYENRLHKLLSSITDQNIPMLQFMRDAIIKDPGKQQQMGTVYKRLLTFNGQLQRHKAQQKQQNGNNTNTPMVQDQDCEERNAVSYSETAIEQQLEFAFDPLARIFGCKPIAGEDDLDLKCREQTSIGKLLRNAELSPEDEDTVDLEAAAAAVVMHVHAAQKIRPTPRNAPFPLSGSGCKNGATCPPTHLEQAEQQQMRSASPATRLQKYVVERTTESDSDDNDFALSEGLVGFSPPPLAFDVHSPNSSADGVSVH
eukprot:TRINITY_DN66840_c3_g1_i1.p1 TRINITY_DN66840_c3_g1~~TRINITY_DN66840_c3_g1_i1.p1  ORF type:complete len:306 (+),score=44.41 TRINITY_DN66840_c3_g1_i1:114-1031(+)